MAVENAVFSDVSTYIACVMSTLDDDGIRRIETASFALSELFRKQYKQRVLDIINREKKVAHAQLSQQLNDSVGDRTNYTYLRDVDNLETCYPPIIQSGDGNYALEYSQESDNNLLDYSSTSAIVSAFGLRYNHVCCNIARTLLVSPTANERLVYELANRALDYLIENLAAGVMLGTLYDKVVEFVKQESPELVPNMTKSLGFVTGIEFCDASIQINSKAAVFACKNMAFVVIIGFSGLKALGTTGKEYAVMLSDTVLVGDAGTKPTNLTGSLERNIESYVIKISDQPADGHDKNANHIEVELHPEGGGTTTRSAHAARNSKVLEQRLRSAHDVQNEEEKRRQHQQELLENLDKTEQKQKEGIVKQDTLQENPNRTQPHLKDLYMRPSISQKRITGTLEANNNGFRYTSLRGQKVDLLYNNIRHAFFRPCDNELVIIIHFHLKTPIMNNKKNLKDIQYFHQVGEVITDLSKHCSYSERDDLEAAERDMRQRLNSAFKSFCDKAGKLSNEQINFDTPFRELSFSGVLFRKTVLLEPTRSCLVNLTETPVVIVTLDGIELVHLERVGSNMRNFDMIVVFKDYAKKPMMVKAVPCNSLVQIRKWLDECDIHYTEGNVSLNWSKIMKTISDDREAFFEEGGWNFLESDGEGGVDELKDGYEEHAPSGSGMELDGDDGDESESSDDYDDDAAQSVRSALSDHEYDVTFKAPRPLGSNEVKHQQVFQRQLSDEIDRAGRVSCLSEDWVDAYVIGIVVAIVSWLLSLYFREVRPDAYIDEIFHIPQAQNYCSGNLTYWDTKITTLPGLYVASAIVLKPVCWLSNLHACCTVFQLRLTNVLYSIAGVFAFWFAYKAVHGSYAVASPVADDLSSSTNAEDVSFARTPRSRAATRGLQSSGQPVSTLHNLRYERALVVLNLAFFPVLYFFSFLFYTEQLSMLLVTLCMLSAHHANGLLFVVSAVSAVFVRQTNIVWVVFFSLVQLDPYVYEFIGMGRSLNTSLRHVSLYEEFLVICSCIQAKLSRGAVGQSINEAFHIVVSRLSSMWIVVAGFAAFLWWNGGHLVVGDKSAHTPVLHLSQFWYFFVFVTLWAWPIMLVDLWERKWSLVRSLVLKLVMSAIPFTQFHRIFRYYRATRLLSRNYMQSLAVALVYVAAAISLYWFAFEHPYLISDNRHFTSIVWRRILRYGWLRLVLVTPLSVWSAFFVVHCIRYRGFLFVALFLGATFAVLVPQKLFEARYFVTPFVIWRLYARPAGHGWVAKIALAVELLIYLGINVATVYIFGYWPIKSGWDGQLQHYIW